MSVTAEHTLDALRARYSREPSEIIDDLRSTARVLNNALNYFDKSRSPGAVTMMESNAEEFCRSLTKLRISLRARGMA